MFVYLHPDCGVEQWQLVGLITQRSEVRILPPLQRKARHEVPGFFVDRPEKACFLKDWKRKKPMPCDSMADFALLSPLPEDHDPPAGGE